MSVEHFERIFVVAFAVLVFRQCVGSWPANGRGFRYGLASGNRSLRMGAPHDSQHSFRFQRHRLPFSKGSKSITWLALLTT